MPDNRNQPVSTIQVLALLKAAGDLAGVRPADLVAYAGGHLRYAAAPGLGEEAEARLDQADLDLLGPVGEPAERVALARDLLAGLPAGALPSEQGLLLTDARGRLDALAWAMEQGSRS